MWRLQGTRGTRWARHPAGIFNLSKIRSCSRAERSPGEGPNFAGDRLTGFSTICRFAGLNRHIVDAASQAQAAPASLPEGYSLLQTA
jgi:hypothetical protein